LTPKTLAIVPKANRMPNSTGANDRNSSPDGALQEERCASPMPLDRPSGWTFTVGQMWSLLTTNPQGIANLAELRPTGEDGNYVVGFTWTREKAIRVSRNFNNKVWAAFAVEDPKTTYSAAFVPTNVMGLNTSPNAATGVNLLPFLANYSNGQATTLAPNLLAKVAFEPGWGHFEIKALGRIFRDRMASTATTSGPTNITEGYGVGFGALMPAYGKCRCFHLMHQFVAISSSHGVL
jgi:hypothetical protein